MAAGRLDAIEVTRPDLLLGAMSGRLEDGAVALLGCLCGGAEEGSDLLPGDAAPICLMESVGGC
jgi:hypothetical protein